MRRGSHSSLSLASRLAEEFRLLDRSNTLCNTIVNMKIAPKRLRWKRTVFDENLLVINDTDVFFRQVSDRPVFHLPQLLRHL